MFSSPRNFAIGAVSIVGISVLTAATGGAITPLLIASGVTMGGIQIAKSAYNAATAATDDEARQAWQGMGAGTTAVAGSVAGAKGALKASGVDTSNMSALKATLQCFKSVPSSIGKSFNAFRTGAALTNIKNAFGINKKENSEVTKTDNKSHEEPENIKNETKADSDITGEVKTETQTKQPETKPDVKAEQKPEAKAEPKAETKTETKPEAKAETKQPETKTEVKTEAETQTTKPEVKAEPKPETKQPETKTEVKTEAETQTTKPEAKAEPKAETKTETKPEVKAEPKAEIKAETKTDSDIAGEVKVETTKPAAAASDKTTLKDITFKNGKATTSTGENFTGTIEDTLNNGKKVKLTYKDGVISDSVITEGGTTVFKFYKNGHIVNTGAIEGIHVTSSKNFSYDDTGKILEIKDNVVHETKNLLYDDDGTYQGYKIKKANTGRMETYSKDGGLIETKSDFSEEITEAVQKLKNNSSDIKEIKLKDGTTETVVRKTKVLNRNTGKYEDMYITSNNNKTFNIRTKDGVSYGKATMNSGTKKRPEKFQALRSNSSDAYKSYDFLELSVLETKNSGMNATNYKGLGTELVKQAVIESYDEGHLGRIVIHADNFTGVGEPAENFYRHIGLADFSGDFNLPEYDIAQFLSK